MERTFLEIDHDAFRSVLHPTLAKFFGSFVFDAGKREHTRVYREAVLRRRRFTALQT
jgi:hypothetical protein